MRGLFAILFLLLLVGLGYVLVTNADRGDVAQTDLRLAADHDETVGDLDELIEEARRNAERAADLAAEIERAANETFGSAEDVLVLADDNEAADASSRAADLAAEDALGAARLMRAYAERMETRFMRTEGYTEDAEMAAGRLETVERTQAEAREAARKAAAARAEMIAAEENLDALEGSLGEDRYATSERAPIEVTRDDGSSIVILNDGPMTEPVEAQGDADYDDYGDDDDAGERLRDIFPDDVIEYEDNGVPYGERG